MEIKEREVPGMAPVLCVRTESKVREGEVGFWQDESDRQLFWGREEEITDWGSVTLVLWRGSLPAGSAPFKIILKMIVFGSSTTAAWR